MNNEEMAMLTWAFQHPYLYTAIELGKPTVIAFLMLVMGRMIFKSGKK